MSIFNSIRKSRQQAKEHMSKIAEQKKKEDEKEPYRHVPTHAAQDAFASAPPSWRETADRPRIIEQNRRRSAMAASGHHMNMPSVPRVGSSLSYVSYPGPGSGGYSSGRAAMRMPRAYSAAGISPYHGAGKDVIYSIPDVAHSVPASLKDYSPSQDGSSSSQDDLEMPKVSRPPVTLGNGRPVSKAHRLHPSSRSRRTSDASVTGPPPAAALSSSAGRQDSWLPYHQPRSSSLSYTPLHAGSAPKPLDANAIAPEPASRANAYADTLRTLESRPNAAPSARTEPPRPAQSVTSQPNTSSSPKSAGFLDFDFGDTPKTDLVHPRELKQAVAAPPAPAPQPIVNAFPEPASESRDPSPPAKGKHRKLTKSGGKLLKKNR